MAQCEEYIPLEWFNNTSPAINAANLNHLEQGIKKVTDCLNQFADELNQRLDTIEDRINNLETNVPSHTHQLTDVTNLVYELDRCPKGSWYRSGDTLHIDIEGS